MYSTKGIKYSVSDLLGYTILEVPLTLLEFENPEEAINFVDHYDVVNPMCKLALGCKMWLQADIMRASDIIGAVSFLDYHSSEHNISYMR